ncbi:MAG TPA: helix-turn-helix domain-containing protein [Brevibacterium sp.]|nr:helix-turn-helix domain-containing protein [Brevibacterium sp.]
MSYWEHTKPVHRARAVDVRGIAMAAVELLDAGGMRALTVRAVAQRLGVAPASLYSRIESVDDLFDLALDDALGADPTLGGFVAGDDLHALMLEYYRHLTRHPWACHVIGMRAPRGPHYLRLSELMVGSLESSRVADPLATAYTLSNFVIGSAATAHIVADEQTATVDPAVAPRYARLHASHAADGEAIVVAGLDALLAGARPEVR